MEVIRYRDAYCASGIANPRWDHDWCRECLVMVRWQPEEEAVLRARGLHTKTPVRQALIAVIAVIAACRKLDPEERARAIGSMLERHKLGTMDHCPPALAEWLTQVANHLDRKGPPPDHWPEDAETWMAGVTG